MASWEGSVAPWDLVGAVRVKAARAWGAAVAVARARAAVARVVAAARVGVRRVVAVAVVVEAARRLGWVAMLH